MPPRTVRRSGINTMSELFAMKKNMASQAIYDYRMASMTKEYYHRKEQLNHDIDRTYKDMKEIQLSTGYTFGPPKQNETNGQARKRINAPKVYFPPIGVRLVKKYVGVDIKRRSSIIEAFGALPEVMSHLSPRKINMDRSSVPIKRSLGKTDAACKEADIGASNDVTTKHAPDAVDATTDVKHAFEADSSGQNAPTETTDTSMSSESELFNEMHPKEATKERELVKDNPLFELVREPNIENIHLPIIVVDDIESATKVQENNQLKNADECEEDQVFLETIYNLEERRSSRSTFRARSSVRHTSQSSLQEHNKEVVSHVTATTNTSLRSSSSMNKGSIGSFSLDYGDGKLHDITEIPRVKDCWRPWCNPHCKSCQNRTTGKPCFILVPVNTNGPMRKIQKDNRSKASFAVYRNVTLKENSNDTDKTRELPTEKVEVTFEETVNDVKKDNNEIILETDGSDAEIDMLEKEIEDVIKARTVQKKRGFSKRRIDELSQPKGGPPPEVRFSKWSLRKKQGQLVEDERQKELEEREKENLMMIQGKISVFLAMLNQQELKTTPSGMVDIPIRENIRVTTKPRRAKSRHGKKKSRFQTKKRRLLLS